jgi:hypothetical protein
VAVLALSLALSLLVCRQYLTRDFIGDDREHLGHCGDVAMGRTTLGEFLIEPHNEHLLPAWKLAYYAQWRWFGLEPLGWHLVMLCSHALGAAALYWLILNATGVRMGAWLAAGLWATAAIGFSDNPLLWVAASHLTLGVAWWLVALAAAAHHAQNPSPAALLILSGSLLLSLAAMGTLWILAPFVAVPLLLDRARLAPRQRIAGLLAWGLPTLVMGLWQAQSILTSDHAQQSTSPVHAGVLLSIGVRTGAEMLSALGNLTFRSLTRPPQETLGQSLLLAIVLLAYLLFAPWLRSRWAWLLMAAATLYTAAVIWARRDVPIEQALAWGRYLYLPTLAWCAVAATVLSMVARNFPNHRRWIALGCALYFTANLWQQSRIAQAAVAEYDSRVAATREYTQIYDGVLREFSQFAQSHDQVLRLWDMPVVDFPVVTELSRYCDYHYPTGLPGVEIVDGRDITELDLNRVTDACQQIDQPQLADALDYFRKSSDVIRLLRRLSAASEASHRAIRLPDLEAVRTSEYLQVPLSWFLPKVFQGGVPGVTVAAADSFARSDAQAALDVLRHEHQPPAPEWRAAMEQWVDQFRKPSSQRP